MMLTKDDIIRMAREAGMEQEGLMFYSPYDDEFDVHIDHLEAFTNLVAAAEREACAESCNRWIINRYDINLLPQAIRGRGQE